MTERPKRKPFMTSSQMRSDIPGAYEPRCRRWNPLPQEPAPLPGIRRAWSSAALPPRRHRTSDARCPPSPRSRSLPCRPPTSPRLCAGDQAHSAFPEKCGISPSTRHPPPKDASMCRHSRHETPPSGNTKTPLSETTRKVPSSVKRDAKFTRKSARMTQGCEEQKSPPKVSLYDKG